MPRTVKQPRKKVVKKVIPEMLPKAANLTEELAAPYMQLHPDYLRKNRDKTGLPIRFWMGQYYWNTNEIDEKIKSSIVYTPTEEV